MAAATWLALYCLQPPLSARLCPFHWLTGLDCPLCGITRGFFALAKGQWREAIQLNALAPLAAVMLLSLAWQTKWVARLWTAGLAAFAIYGVIRIAV